MMGKQFAYFYFMKSEPEKIKSVVSRHIGYWENKPLAKYSGGPFSDRSGGLITFEADSIETATEITEQDPFATESLLENKWLKEWIVGK